MLLVFVICWLPLNLLKLMDDLEVDCHLIFRLLEYLCNPSPQVPLVCWPYYYLTFFTCHLFAMSSTCWNPILYGQISRWMRQKY